MIFQRRGNGTIIKKDKARFIKKQGKKRVYELKNKGVETQPIPYKHIQSTDEGKPVLFLYEYDRDHFKPVNSNVTKNAIEDEDIDVEPVDEADIAWEQYTVAMSEEIHEGDEPWFVKHQQFIVMFLTFVFLIIMSYLFMDNISTQSQNIVEAFEQGMTNGGPPG